MVLQNDVTNRLRKIYFIGCILIYVKNTTVNANRITNSIAETWKIYTFATSKGEKYYGIASRDDDNKSPFTGKKIILKG